MNVVRTLPHEGKLHFIASSLNAGHDFPPWRNGLLHILFLDFVAIPQVAEQVDQALHADHSGPTKLDAKFKNVKNQFLEIWSEVKK